MERLFKLLHRCEQSFQKHSRHKIKSTAAQRIKILRAEAKTELLLSCWQSRLWCFDSAAAAAGSPSFPLAGDNEPVIGRTVGEEEEEEDPGEFGAMQMMTAASERSAARSENDSMFVSNYQKSKRCFLPLMISDAQEIPSEIPEQIKLPYLFNIQNNPTYHIQMCHVLNVLDNHTISC